MFMWSLWALDRSKYQEYDEQSGFLYTEFQFCLGGTADDTNPLAYQNIPNLWKYGSILNIG